MAARFVLHHNPQSRAQRIKWLLEELEAEYEIVSHDLTAGTHKSPEFLKVNPHGKIPTLIDRGPDGTAEAVLTESGAIVIHLADVFPEAGLAPTPGTPERGPYLTWVVYGSAVMEPALTDMIAPRKEAPAPGMVGWPPLAEAFDRVASAVEPGPWLLGDRFSAADVNVGSFLDWLSRWDKLIEPARFEAYLGRLRDRPAYKRAYAG